MSYHRGISYFRLEHSHLSQSEVCRVGATGKKQGFDGSDQILQKCISSKRFWGIRPGQVLARQALTVVTINPVPNNVFVS
jgi:hypothetical protein